MFSIAITARQFEKTSRREGLDHAPGVTFRNPPWVPWHSPPAYTC
jgi:hypothetical protein